jgi:hypothetical protein
MLSNCPNRLGLIFEQNSKKRRMLLKKLGHVHFFVCLKLCMIKMMFIIKILIISIRAHWHGPYTLFWFSSFVDSRCLSVAPQSGAKENCYSTVYNITLNSKLREHLKIKKCKR